MKYAAICYLFHSSNPYPPGRMGRKMGALSSIYYHPNRPIIPSLPAFQSIPLFIRILSMFYNAKCSQTTSLRPSEPYLPIHNSPFYRFNDNLNNPSTIHKKTVVEAENKAVKQRQHYDKETANCR